MGERHHTGEFDPMALTVPTTRTRPRAAPVVAMLGLFVALDAQKVNVALPTIRDHLGGGLVGLQWIVAGYTMMFSALQLFSGTLSDRVGARRAYGIGMAVLALASLTCGLAPALGVLIASRVVQGVRRRHDHPHLPRPHSRRV